MTFISLEHLLQRLLQERNGRIFGCWQERIQHLYYSNIHTIYFSIDVSILKHVPSFVNSPPKDHEHALAKSHYSS